MSERSREQQVSSGAIYLIPALAGNLIPLATLPVFTRILTPDEYGAWALATAYAVFVTGLANFGLTVSYDRCYYERREPREASALLYSVLAFVASMYAVSIAVTWVFRDRIAAAVIGSADGASLLFWVACANGLASLKFYYLAYLRNRGDARSYVWFTVDETVLTAAFSLVLVAYFRVGVRGLAWGQAAAAGLVLILVTARFLRTLRPRLSGAALADALRLGYPLAPRIFLGVVGSQFDKYLLGLLGSTSAVGVYAIGQKISYLVFAYMNALENLFAPETYRRMFDMGAEGGASIGRYLTPFAYLSCAIALAVTLFAEEALWLLTPPAYHAAAGVVHLLALHYAVMFLAKQPQLVYAKKTHLLSVLTMVTLGLSVAGTIAGIRWMGMLGAAAGTLTAGVLGVLIFNAIAVRYYRIEWQYGRLAQSFGILFAASGALLALEAVDGTYGARIAVKAVALAAFAAAGMRAGIVTRDNARLIARMVRGRLGLAAGTPAS